MNIYKPIIIIGAGRSGTTLLTKIFSAHPEIDFHGETFFLVPRLWLEIWGDRFWFNWLLYTNTNPCSAHEKFPAVPLHALLEEQRRIGRIVAKGIVDLLKIDEKVKKVWGFKEIWNGSSKFEYDWEAYDKVFPEALWVHITRNPFDFALSNANWNRSRLDINFLRDRLTDWVSMTRYSRRRSDTDRYYEVRYERLVQDPKSVLEPVLDRVNLSWYPACDKISQKFYLRSEQALRRADESKDASAEIEKMVCSVDGLTELMDQFGYKIPEKIVDCLALDNEVQSEQETFVNLHDVENLNESRRQKPQYLWQELYEKMTLKGTIEQRNFQFSRDLELLTVQNQQLAKEKQEIAAETRQKDNQIRQNSDEIRQLIAQNNQLRELNQELDNKNKMLSDAHEKVLSSEAYKIGSVIQRSPAVMKMLKLARKY